MTEAHPLAATAARADATRDWLSITLGESVPDAWVRCSAVDAAVVIEWEDKVQTWHQAMFGQTHPMATSGYVVSYYADIVPTVGAMFFTLARRVPRLDRESVAFRTDPEHACPITMPPTTPRRPWCRTRKPSARCCGARSDSTRTIPGHLPARRTTPPAEPARCVL